MKSCLEVPLGRVEVKCLKDRYHACNLFNFLRVCVCVCVQGRWVIVWVVHLAGAGTARDSTPPSAMAAKRILTIYRDIYRYMS